jgi:hypothetical protein
MEEGVGMEGCSGGNFVIEWKAWKGDVGGLM